MSLWCTCWEATVGWDAVSLTGTMQQCISCRAWDSLKALLKGSSKRMDNHYHSKNFLWKQSALLRKWLCHSGKADAKCPGHGWGHWSGNILRTQECEARPIQGTQRLTRQSNRRLQQAHDQEVSQSWHHAETTSIQHVSWLKAACDVTKLFWNYHRLRSPVELMDLLHAHYDVHRHEVSGKAV